MRHVQQGFSSCGTQNRMGLGPFVVSWFTVGHCRRQIPIGVDLMENRRFPWSFLLLFCCATGSNRISVYTCKTTVAICMYIERNNQPMTLSNQPTNQLVSSLRSDWC